MRLGFVVVAALMAGPAMAELPARAPAGGVAILDCAPPAPAPTDACILRVPPGLEREKMTSTQGKFIKAQDLATRLPGVAPSSTLVLIDLTPGPGGERKATWAQERALIATFVGALPPGERVALYGFNETLERLSDFGTDRAAQADLIGKLELRGTNTRIATYARDAINVLGAQDHTLLRNLVVVSDGEEEGTRDLAEVTSAAQAHGVTVSALGMLWRPVGAPQNGAGMDYLTKLTEDSHGLSRPVQIRGGGNASAEVENLAAALGKAIAASGLIVPEGTPVAADISVVLRRPVAGVAGQFSEETVSAHFTPAAAPALPTGPTPWLQEMFLGLPRLWWLLGAVALVLLLAGLGFALRRREEEPLEELLGTDDAIPPLPAAAPEALAWLVREDTGERLAVRKTRTTIGRTATSDLVLNHPSVSRLHAELLRDAAQGFAVTDSGSLNKTRVNGRAITRPQALKPGDVVSFGEVKLRFTKV